MKRDNDGETSSQNSSAKAGMGALAAWDGPGWEVDAASRMDDALAAAGHPRTGPVETIKS